MDIIIKSQVPKDKQQRQKRKSNGMKKCLRCPICPFIKEAKTVRQDNTIWKLNRQITCQSENIVYMIICKKETCKLKYIGESERSIKDRISEHITYIRTKNKSQATGEHFNLPGHSLHDMEAIGLEIVYKKDILYRKERESYLIRKFNTFRKGINKQP